MPNVVIESPPMIDDTTHINEKKPNSAATELSFEVERPKAIPLLPA